MAKIRRTISYDDLAFNSTEQTKNDGVFFFWETPAFKPALILLADKHAIERYDFSMSPVDSETLSGSVSWGGHSRVLHEDPNLMANFPGDPSGTAAKILTHWRQAHVVVPLHVKRGSIADMNERLRSISILTGQSTRTVTILDGQKNRPWRYKDLPIAMRHVLDWHWPQGSVPSSTKGEVSREAIAIGCRENRPELTAHERLHHIRVIKDFYEAFATDPIKVKEAPAEALKELGLS